MNDASLQAAFSAFGEVAEARVVLDRETGRSRGFGFVTFGTEEAAETAAREMNEQMLDGRAIRVDLAKEQPGSRRD